MLTLIHGGTAFAPEPLGKKDFLILGDKIGAVAEPGQIRIKGVELEVIDASDKIVLPGLIDSHAHILGGGGEGGPTTRAPEITSEDIITSGITTIIGCLGTDGVTRHIESLLAKARALEAEGITTYIFSGSYQIPVLTLMGSIQRDLILIDKVIGAGEIAISDHRSSQPTFEEIARLAAECRVGGMLGGKAGVLHLHLGDGPRGLEMLFRLIKETEIPITQVIPTHVNRNQRLFGEAMDFALQGGYFDLTTGPDHKKGENREVGIEDAIRLCLKKKVPLSQITISSDSNGSMPVFDQAGRLIGLTIATQKDLFRNFRDLIVKKIIKVEEAVRLFSTNEATFYKLSQKGELKAGKDADLIILDKNLHLTDLFARGQRMIAERRVFPLGTFRAS